MTKPQPSSSWHRSALPQLQCLLADIGGDQGKLLHVLQAPGEGPDLRQLRQLVAAPLRRVSQAITVAQAQAAARVDPDPPPDFSRCSLPLVVLATTPAGWCASQWAQFSIQVQRATCILAIVESTVQAPLAPEVVEEGLMQLQDAYSAADDAVPRGQLRVCWSRRAVEVGEAAGVPTTTE